MSIAGTFFSGEVLRSHPVTFEFTPEGRVRGAGDGLAFDHPASAVSVSDRLGDVPRFVYLPDNAVIETSDNSAVDAALLAQRRSRGARAIHLLESHHTVAAVACVIVVALIAATLYFAPPALARTVARRVPANLDHRAGEIALAAIAPYFARSTLTTAERERVRVQLRRLRPGVADTALPRLEFRSMNGGLPNAFALPGNLIVVTDELVRLPAHDDELAAVLAHELGHLESRHGLQSVLRGSFALLIVTAVTGDLSTLTSFAATIPLSILTQGYSRDLEREADRYALEQLRERGIEPTHFTRVLIKLEAARVAIARTSTYLSTHPSTEERQELFGRLAEEDETAVLAEGDSSPVPIYRARPEYPFAMRRQGVQGEVMVDFTIDVHGAVQGAKALHSTRPEFEPAAIAAVRQWRFHPGRKGFKPVDTAMQVPIVFTLDATAPSRPSPSGR